MRSADSLSVLVGKVADALTDAVHTQARCTGLAGLDLLRHLLAPNQWVWAAGERNLGRRSCNRGSRGGDRDPREDLDADCGAGAAQKPLLHVPSRFDFSPSRDRAGCHRVDDPMQLALQLPLKIVHMGKYNAGPGPINQCWSAQIRERLAAHRLDRAEK